MLFSCNDGDSAPGGAGCYWSSTRISGCGRTPCATRWASSARRRWCASVAENGVDPTPLWKTYVDAGWTELTDPENAVELAIVLEELGRATDPTPFLATLTQFAPLVGDRFDPQPSGTAVYGGVTAHRDADGWVLDGTARHVLDGDRAERLAVVTDGRGVRRRRRRRHRRGAARSSTRCCTSPRCRSPACTSPDDRPACTWTPSGPATSR